MSEASRENERTRQEAAEWFTRLSRRSVTTQAIRDFREWRRDPANRAAYELVESVWNRAGALAGDPDIERLRRDTTRRAAGRRRARRAALRASLAIGALALGLAVVFLAYRQAPDVYESEVGEQRIVRLADGSTLRLNTDSRVAVAMDEGERSIRLQRGEALFEVAHDPNRPFLVRADGAVVRALGTVFDVRLKSAGAVDVTLLEGAVQVSTSSGRALTLKPAERAQVRGDGLAKARLEDARRAVSWTERRLIFHHTPLAAGVEEVNRYARAKVVLEADDLAAAPVSGAFETGDSQAFAAAVASLFDLEMTSRGDSEIVLRRP